MLGTTSSRPLYWGILSLGLFVVSCLMPSGHRLPSLLIASFLLVAIVLVWKWPQAERWLRLCVGAWIALYCGFSMWRYGFSCWFCIGIAGGLDEMVISLFFWFGETSNEEGLSEDEEQTERPHRQRKKRKRIAKALTKDDDGELFSVVFHRIVRHYGEDLDVSDLREHERTFLLAYDAWGIIGNGGFNYLFERSIRGDPHFFKTAEAFGVIGCDAAAEAFRRVFRLFPDGMPPEDVGLRLYLYRRGPGDKRGAIDDLFWSAKEEIQSRLASYLRAHGEELVELDRLPLRKRLRRKQNRRIEREGEEGRSQRGSDVESLPHWARVAFAARCARRVWPLFAANWSEALPKHTEALTTAIELAERSAAAAQSVEGLEKARMNAIMTAGAAMFGLYGNIFEKEDQEPLPTDGNAAVCASFVAKTADFAAEAAKSSPVESAEQAMGAFRWALQAASANAELQEALWRDLAQLQHVALRGDWTDQTPVPPDVWSLLE